MSVARISNINIKERGLFTAIFGDVDEEFFVDEDLRSYSLNQQLYLYLKKEGYNSIVFYDNSDNFYSFSEEDLIIFFSIQDIKEKSNVNHENIEDWDIIGPLGRNSFEPKSLQEDIKTIHESIKLVTRFGRRDSYFASYTKTTIFDHITMSLSNVKSKCAIIVTEFSKFEGINDYISFFRNLSGHYKKNNLLNKIIITYGCNNCESLMDLFEIHSQSNYLFLNVYFKNIFFLQDNTKKNHSISKNITYQIQQPDQQEIRNWLNRKRTIENISFIESENPDKVVLNLAQQQKFIKELEDIDLLKFIDNINTSSAWNLLDNYLGIEDIIEQFERTLPALKRKSGRNIKKRPHMVFKGNPGTGKTTIAEIFGKILQEENVLKIGHWIHANPKQMIGEHIGETRIKTYDLCEQSIGGILFIDEAHGLLDDEDQKGYGKDAIEVLIQFMENNPESLVILAGYPKQIDDLLEKGDPGFISRFKKTNHYIFKDYSPIVLFEIAKKKLNNYVITEEALEAIRNILVKMYDHREPFNWGNARIVESLIDSIDDELHFSMDEKIDVNHIPQDYLNLINQTNKNKKSGFSAIAGMESLKSTLKNDVINAIQNPEEFKKHNIGIPNGMLLYGPPGCGKTFFAKKFGEEVGFNFIEVKASDIANIYHHGTQQEIGKLFDKARRSSPAILYFDEFDAMVPNRKNSNNSHLSGEVNEFLFQLNNIGDSGVFVIASTNCPELIDPAVLRAGRIEKKVYVSPPDFEARKVMFELYLKDRPISDDIDYSLLAIITENYVSSDIKLIIDSASRKVIKNKLKHISMDVLKEIISLQEPSVSLS